MSALAARRAAQAALASVKAADPAPPAPASKRQKAPEPVPQSPESPSVSDYEESVASEPEPSTKRRKTAKVAKSATPTTNTRYYAAPEEPEEKSKRSRKQRRFSPSAAVASDDDDAGSSEDEDESEAAFETDMDGAATPWSTAQSPRVMEPGPSRQSLQTLRPATSTFVPKEGTNLVRIKEAAIKSAGLEFSGPCVAVALDAGETLLIAGTYRITPLRHSVSLAATTLKTSPEALESYPVFAPTSHPVPVLTAEVEEEVMLESPALSSLCLPKAFTANESRSVFLIQENRCGIEGLRGDVVPGFQNIWLDGQSVWGLRGVHPVIGSTFTPVYPHVTPDSWAYALDSLRDEQQVMDDDESPPPQDRVPVVLVKGPKRSGKSSLARASLNRLLDTYERVAWLECDLGQGEFSAGGAVGLWVVSRPVFGPPFTHPQVPERSQYLGELSPQSCPDEYMAAIQGLLTHYQYEMQYPPALLTSGRRRTDTIPLVINTQGWIKGLGEDLMRAIEMTAEPTHIFAFEQAEEASHAPSAPGWTNSPVQITSELPMPWDMGPQSTAASASRVFSLEPAPSSSLQARYTAADMRALTTIAYMHARLGPRVQWGFSAPLFAIRPYTVQLGGDAPLQRAFLIGEGADAVSSADLPLALNGHLVALLDAPSAVDEDVYVPGRAQPLVDEASFLGLALVRAVRADPVSSRLDLQLLTPLGGADLARATAIAVNGAMELPTCGLLDWRERVPGGGVSEDGLAGARWDDVPFFDAAGTDAAGGDRRRFRRNIQRKGI